MDNTPAQTVDQYLEQLKPEDKQELQKLIKVVKEIVPDVEESISYQMPAYKYKGKPLIYFGAFKNHLSIFPTSGPIARLEPKLKKFKVAKGTIQFTAKESVPESLVKELLNERLKQIG